MNADFTVQALVKQLSGDNSSWVTTGTPLTNASTDFADDVSVADVDGVAVAGWAAAQCSLDAFGDNAFVASFLAGQPSNTAATGCPLRRRP